MSAVPAWRPAEAARELAWWDATRLAALQRDLAAALCPWASGWGLSAPVLGCESQCRPASLEGRWTPLLDGVAPRAWLQWPQAALLAMLFPGGGPCGSLAREMAAACARDALRRIAQLLELQPADSGSSAPGGTETRACSGTVMLTIDAARHCALVLSAAASARWRAPNAARPPQRQPALTRVSDAVAQRPTALHAQLKGCELALGDLQGLQIGDVLRLPHPLSEPAAIADAEGRPLFTGHLAQQRGARVVELAPLSH